MRFVAGLAAALLAFATPTAFASPIPTSEGLVVTGGNFIFGTEPGSAQVSGATSQDSTGGALGNATFTTFSSPDSTALANQKEIFSLSPNTLLAGVNADTVQNDASSDSSNLAAADPVASVPEPTSLTLLGTALAGLALLVRRRRKSA